MGIPMFQDDGQNIDYDIRQLLRKIDRLATPSSAYHRALHDGLQALIRRISIPNDQTWEDAIDYSRAAITSPNDANQINTSTGTRSHSNMHQELLRRFGPDISKTARTGYDKIISDYYRSDRNHITSVNRERQFQRYWHEQLLPETLNPKSNPLAVACYESGALPQSISYRLGNHLTPQSACLRYPSECL